jgi:hypothetical protein
VLFLGLALLRERFDSFVRKENQQIDFSAARLEFHLVVPERSISRSR